VSCDIIYKTIFHKALHRWGKGKGKPDLVHVMQPYRGRGGVALLILNLGTSWRCALSLMGWPSNPRKWTQCPIEQEAGLAPETVWSVWRNQKYVFPAGIQFPGRQAHLPVTDWNVSALKNVRIIKVIMTCICLMAGGLLVKTWRQSVTRRDVRYVPRKTRFRYMTPSREYASCLAHIVIR